MVTEASSASTRPTTRPVPVWLDLETPTFGLYHAPAEPSHPLAVLFCAPLGSEDMCSYPVRRQWALALAAAGHPVLRFDLPGSGHSGGGPSDAHLTQTSVEATSAAAAWLRAQSGVTAVAAIGIGFGALLALQAAAQGAPLDDLALWGLPKSGRGLIRSMRAFSALQAGASPDGDAGLPDGWLEAGGFMFSPETMDDISRLRIDGPGTGALRRVLLLRAGGPFSGEDRAAELLRDSGAQITVADGPGYEDIHESPHLVSVPKKTIAVCEAWLAAEGAASVRDPGAAPSARGDVRIEHEGITVRERPFEIETPLGMMFGVLAEPLDDGSPGSDLALICLPAMAERSIGPSRLWVELARRHAARGVPTLRVDLLSIGDSDGDPERMRHMETIFQPSRADEVRAVLDSLESAGVARRFALVGLCSGGHWAMRTGLADPRVARLLLLNPAMPAEAKTVLVRTALRRPLRTLADPAIGQRVRRLGVAAVLAAVRREIRRVTGSSGPSVAAAPAPAPDQAAAAPAQSPPTPGPTGRMLAQFAADYRGLPEVMRARGGTLDFGVGQGEASYWMLKLSGLLGGLRRRTGYSVTVIQTTDHNLRTYSDQRTVHRLADEMLSDWQPAAARHEARVSSSAMKAHQTSSGAALRVNASRWLREQARREPIRRILKPLVGRVLDARHRSDSIRQRWERSAGWEVGHWEAWLTSPESESWFAPDSVIDDPEIVEAIERLDAPTIRILDVGSGPVTTVQKTYPGKTIEITPTDALADEYDRILAATGKVPPVRTIKLEGEQIAERYPEPAFEIAHSSNALDHCYDPAEVIAGMIGAVVPGGFVLLNHHVNEAESQHYVGLHQWNFASEDGRFILWNRSERHDLSERFADRAEVSCKMLQAADGERLWTVLRKR
jgi:dienelactone hydrolase/SAM-dependent methyltransferase